MKRITMLALGALLVLISAAALSQLDAPDQATVNVNQGAKPQSQARSGDSTRGGRFGAVTYGRAVPFGRIRTSRPTSGEYEVRRLDRWEARRRPETRR